jgi:AraC-like DNA-binding protein
MSTIGYVFVAAGSILCQLVAILLWRFSTKKAQQQQFLSIIFFAIGWYALMYLLVSTGWIINFPFLFRLGVPFYYVIPPCTLFYTRLFLNNRNNIPLKQQLTHGLPFLLSVVDIIFYYVRNYGQLGYIAEQVLLNPTNSFFIGSGFIPASMHYLFRPAQGVLYSILICIAFYQSSKKSGLKNMGSRSLEWIILFNVFLAANYLSLFYTAFIVPSDRYPLLEVSILFAFMAVISFFAISIRLFFTPSLIYQEIKTSDMETEWSIQLEDKEILGKEMQNKDKGPMRKNSILSESQIQGIAMVLDQVMVEQQLFKKINKLAALADYLDLSPRYLSHVLNKHYNLNFNDYVNSFRINHIIQVMETDDYKKFTLEALAKDAGFSSRTTFFTAFKKHTGDSPAQYFVKKRS